MPHSIYNLLMASSRRGDLLPQCSGIVAQCAQAKIPLAVCALSLLPTLSSLFAVRPFAVKSRTLFYTHTLQSFPLFLSPLILLVHWARTQCFTCLTIIEITWFYLELLLQHLPSLLQILHHSHHPRDAENGSRRHRILCPADVDAMGSW